MLTLVVDNLRRCWRKLLVADLLFKVIAFVILTPLVSVLFRLFIAASGRDVVADADIPKFLLHPVGAVAFVVVAGLLLAIFAWEQAILMTIATAAKINKPVSIAGVFHFVATRAGTGILRLTWRVVSELALFALPFLAAGGLLFWLLLTDHDINFYLQSKPPKFWLAVGLIGTCLAAMVVVLLWRIANYVFATQILLLEQTSPRQSLVLSRQRAMGHRLTIVMYIVVWAVANFALGIIVTWLVGSIGRPLLINAVESVWMTVLAVGVTLLLVGIGNLATNAIAGCTLGSLLAMAYHTYGRRENMDALLPDVSERASVSGITPTPSRVIAASVLAIIVAGLIGSAVVQSFDLDDSIVITAHRGGAVAAPENTLAAIEQAIVDRADWVEIDVQESSDGVVLVVHDSDLKKVAGNATKIWEATAEELRQIDIGSYHSAEFSDQRIPTLEEVLVACRGRVKVNIELKYYGHTQDLEAKVVQLVEKLEMQNEIVIMSLKQAGLDKIKKMRPEWTCGLLTAVSAGDLTRASADFLAVSSALATKSFISRAHSRGKEVAAWTLNDAISISQMISRGVDNVITDDPALVHRVLEQREALSPAHRMLLELAFLFGVDPPATELEAF
ncbi:MAG: glycerophosphodiester phosphodiesterase [Aureliella sp.]